MHVVDALITRINTLHRATCQLQLFTKPARQVCLYTLCNHARIYGEELVYCTRRMSADAIYDAGV